MFPSHLLLSHESSVSVKENLDRKKSRQGIFAFPLFQGAFMLLGCRVHNKERNGSLSNKNISLPHSSAEQLKRFT